MFILLTTANHPDIVMNFYDASPASFLLLVSFMILTFYFLMNLLLGEVYNTYQVLVTDSSKKKVKMKRAVLKTCYRKLEETGPQKQVGISKDTFVKIIDAARPCSEGEKGDQKKDIWYAMLGGGKTTYIECDEFLKFEDVRDAPLRLKDTDEVSKKEAALREARAKQKCAPRNLKHDKKQELEEEVKEAKKELKKAIKHRGKEQRPVFPALHCFFVSGSMADARPQNEASAHKEGDKGWRATPASKHSFLHYGTWGNFVDFVTAISVGYMAFTDADDTCDEEWALSIEIAVTTIFVLDVLFRIFAEMKYNNYCAFFNTGFFNYIDMAAAIVMFLNLMLCTGSGSSTEARSAVAIVRIFRCLRLAHSLKGLRQLIKMCRYTLAVVAPQFILFVIVYYFFGTIGMALFAGDVTKVTSEGGPGEWSTEPWASTAYGSTSYYYALNFDNIGRSFFTLFTLMVQNNWSVTADGFMQTNDRWSRIFFFVFNVTAVMLMINIFVSTVMFFYDFYLANNKAVEAKKKQLRDGGEVTVETLAEKIQEDLQCMFDDVPDKIKGDWFIKEKIEDAEDILLGGDDEAEKSAKQDRELLDRFPCGICIQELDGTYTWANKEYKRITITDQALHDIREGELDDNTPLTEEEKNLKKTGKEDDFKLTAWDELTPDQKVDLKGKVILAKQKYAGKQNYTPPTVIKKRKQEREALIARWREERKFHILKNKKYDQTKEQWCGHDLDAFHSEVHNGRFFEAVSRPVELLNKDIYDPTQTEVSQSQSVTGVVMFLMAQEEGQSKTLQFMRLDTNHNEFISRAEWVLKFGKGSEEHFDNYDQDGDGVISKAEWDARTEERIRKIKGEALLLQKQTNKKELGQDDPAAPIPVSTWTEKFGEHSRDHYLRTRINKWFEKDPSQRKAQKEEMNRAKQGLKFQEELPESWTWIPQVRSRDVPIFSRKWMQQVFERVDTDHSRKINAEELLKLFSLFLDDNADLDDSSGGESALTLTKSMVKEFGKAHNMKKLEQVAQFGHEIDTDGDGELNFDEFYSMIMEQGLFDTLRDLSVTKADELAYTESLDVVDLKRKLEDIFDEIDDDNNEVIDEGELYDSWKECASKWSSLENEMVLFEPLFDNTANQIETLIQSKPKQRDRDTAEAKARLRRLATVDCLTRFLATGCSDVQDQARAMILTNKITALEQNPEELPTQADKEELVRSLKAELAELATLQGNQQPHPKVIVMENPRGVVKNLVTSFGLKKPGYLTFEEFARMMTECNLWSYYGLKPAEGVDFSRLSPRYKAGTEVDPFTRLEWYRKTVAALMIRDATHFMNGIYFISMEGEASGHSQRELKNMQCAQSIWSDEPAAVAWARTLRSAYYCTLFRTVATLLMIATAFEEPRMWTEVPTAVGIGISIACTLIIWCVFFIYMRCMWPCKRFWYNSRDSNKQGDNSWRASTEEYWLLGLGLALIFCTIGIIIDLTQENQSSIDTIFGEVRIDRFAMVLKVTRTYFVLFFSPSMRAGFLSAYKVFSRLWNVFGLILISFVMHYFLFLAIMSHDQYKKNIGMNEGKYKDGLWNFFVTLTTANHPDIVMELYHNYQLSAFVLVSFMVFTQYFLMSLLLGVVSNEYSEIYTKNILDTWKKEKLIFETAYEMVKPVDIETFSEIVSLYGDGKGDDREMIQVWFDMMDVDGSGTVEKDEFMGLKKILNAPIARIENVGRRKGAPLYPFFNTFAKQGRLSNLFSCCCAPTFQQGDQVDAVYVDGKWLEASNPHQAAKFYNKDTNECAVIEEFEADTNELDAWVNNLTMERGDCEKVREFFKDKFPEWKSLSDVSHQEAIKALNEESSSDLESETWKKVMTEVKRAFKHHQSSYPGPYYTVRYADGTRKYSESAINLRGSGCSQVNAISYLGWEAMVDFVTIFSVIWTVFIPSEDVCDTDHGLTFEIIFTSIFMIDIIVSPLGSAYKGHAWAYFESYFRWLDIISAIGMLVSVSLCAGDGSRQLRKVIGLVRVLRCFRLTYSLDALKKICDCAVGVGALISSQLILFVLQYYTFAVIGMACFAGDVTKTTAAGGPGYWTDAPYSSTAFGGTAYYYRLNFDNIGNSFATLFTQMVMNNWSVTVNGYEETNEGGRWVRIYFFIFHIMTVWLSVNILIGTIMTAYAKLYARATDAETDESLEKMSERLSACNNGYHTRRWKIDKTGGINNRTLFAEEEADDLSPEKLKIASKLVRQTRYIITCCPIPAYITTSGGKYTLVNDYYNLLASESRKFVGKDGIPWERPDLTGFVEPEFLYNQEVNPKFSERQQSRERVIDKWHAQQESGLEDSEPDKGRKESFILTLNQSAGVQARTYLEHMIAYEQYIKTVKGGDGTITYFMSDDIGNRRPSAPAEEADSEEDPEQM
jgi:Ca2+-binding EF-hand superfamily protein